MSDRPTDSSLQVHDVEAADAAIRFPRGTLPNLSLRPGVAAGLHMTLALPDHVDDRELANAARGAGVSVQARSSYAINRRGLRGLVIG